MHKTTQGFWLAAAPTENFLLMVKLCMMSTVIERRLSQITSAMSGYCYCLSHHRQCSWQPNNQCRHYQQCSEPTRRIPDAAPTIPPNCTRSYKELLKTLFGVLLCNLLWDREGPFPYWYSSGHFDELLTVARGQRNVFGLVPAMWKQLLGNVKSANHYWSLHS